MQNKKTLILISGIFYLINTVLSMVFSIFLLFSINPILEIVKNDLLDRAYIEQITLELSNQILNMVNVGLWVVFYVSIAVCVLCLIFGIMLIIHSVKIKEEKDLKRGLIITSIVITFLTGSIVSMILLLIAICSNPKNAVYATNTNNDLNDVIELKNSKNTKISKIDNKIEKTDVKAKKTKKEDNDLKLENQSSNINTNELNSINNKIARIKKLKEENAITTEEYNELLKKIFKN